MDALALLCTLHADGPRTTRRLRHLGIQTLDGLREMPIAELADALESSSKGAERFLREAQILLKRVRHEAVEVKPRKAPKKTTAQAHEAAAPAPLQLPVTPREPAPAQEQEPGQVPTSLHSPFGPGVSSARTTPAFGRSEPTPSTDVEEQDEGRSAPEDQTAPSTAVPASDSTLAAPDGAEVEEGDPGLQRYVINPLVRPVKPLRLTHVPESGSGVRIPLRPGLLDGLDEDACRRLGQHGIESVEDLASTSGLDLALDLNWPYDRVFHLKKAASQYQQAPPTQQDTPAVEPDDVDAVEDAGAMLGSEDEGAAGPFA